MSAALEASAQPPCSLRCDYLLNLLPFPSCLVRSGSGSGVLGLCHRRAVPTAAKHSFSTSHKKKCDGFRPWQNGIPFLALQAKTVKAKRKI